MSPEYSVQFTKLINQGHTQNFEYSWLYKSHLFETLIHHVYSELELVQNFTKIYNAETHYIDLDDGMRDICFISPEKYS
jgi:hypothetical protein